MLETAWNYSEIATSCVQRKGQIANVLAALAIEILLKSFDAEPVANIGKVNERSRFRDTSHLGNSHDLERLFLSLSLADRSILLQSDDEEELLSTHKDTFTKQRYIYEEQVSAGFDTRFVTLADRMICRAVKHAHDQGEDDPFVVFAIQEIARRSQNNTIHI